MQAYAQQFMALRPVLVGLAYRMLGSHADAEDVVQDAFLRWQGVDNSSIDSPEAWLKTVVTRLSIDRLRQLKKQREQYQGPWLPEPFSRDDVAPPADSELDLLGDLSLAFVTLLEQLTPYERGAFLLKDVFDMSYPDIAAIVRKSEAACRQLVRRGRSKIDLEKNRFRVSRQVHETLLQRFMRAAETGDRRAIAAFFHADVQLTSDGGGVVPAVFKTLRGPTRIAWLFYAVARQKSDFDRMEITNVNGLPGVVAYRRDVPVTVTYVLSDGERIHRIYVVRNPAKLAAFVTEGQADTSLG